MADTSQSFLSRVGLSTASGPALPYLRVILSFLKEFGEEQLKQIPGVGPAITALLELSKEEDSRKLEERIESLLPLGQETQESVSLAAALAAATLFYQQKILARFDQDNRQIDVPQIVEFAVSTALAAYRQRIALDFLYTDYRGVQGVTRQEHVASLPMEQVYVIPRLVAETGYDAAQRSGEESLLRELENEDLTVTERTRLEEQYAVVTGLKWRGAAQGLSAPDVLAKVRHIALLGGPGVGKSTFTRFLARACALGPDEMRSRLGWAEELTPIILSLAGFADDRRTDPNLSLRQHLDSFLLERGGEALRIALARELEAGRALVLLDGVDEVPDSTMRVSVVRAVDLFIADHFSNRLVVTSRPFGYSRLRGEVSHYVMPNFTSSQVRTFVVNWHRAFEKWCHPSAPNLATADSESEATLSEIHRNNRVTELATNPLMLVIVCLIRREGRRLPEKRVQLYDRAVRTLLETWNQWRSQSGIDVGGARLPAERLIRVFGAVAEWTRRTKPTGIMHRMDLRRMLTHTLTEMELDDESPEATAESYLNAAADRAGLLEEKGKDIFAFWHPTFEEFLAAVDLTTPTSRATERLLPLRSDPRWREVILLAVGYVGVVQHDSETATEIVRSLSETRHSLLECLFHENLRLSAACIADDVGAKRTLAQTIIMRLAEMVAAMPYEPLAESFSETTRSLNRIHPSREAVATLSSLAKHSLWQVRMEAARLLGNVANTDRDALELCRELLSDSDPDVRCHAALGLARAGEHRPSVISALLHFRSQAAFIQPAMRTFLESAPESVWAETRKLLGSEAPPLRLAAALALIEFGQFDDKAFGALDTIPERELLAGDGVQVVTARGRKDDRIVPLLMRALDADETHVRCFAAIVLLAIAPFEEKFANVLLRIMSGVQGVASGEAKRALIARANENSSLSAMLEVALGESDAKLRLAAASLLLILGHSQEQVSAVLSSSLTHEDAEVRHLATELIYSPELDTGTSHGPALVMMNRIAAIDLELIPGLLFDESTLLDSILPHNSFYYTGWARAGSGISSSVIERIAKRENVRSSLSARLNNGLPAERLAAAEALAALKLADELTVKTLEPILRSADSTVRFRSALILVSLGRAEATVAASLLSLAEGRDPVATLARATLRVLLRAKDVAAESELLGALDRRNTHQAFQAACLLTSAGYSDERLAATLESALGLEDAQIRLDAALALEKVGRTDERVAGILFESLGAAGASRSAVASALVRLAKTNPAIPGRLVNLACRSEPPVGLRSVLLGSDWLTAEFVESAALAILDGFAEVLPAWKVFIESGQVSFVNDAHSLRSLVSVSSGDSNETRIVRELLYTQMWRRHANRDRDRPPEYGAATGQ